MNENSSSWEEYGRLVLKELERLNDNQQSADEKIQNLTTKIELVIKEVDAHRQVDEKVFEELAKDITEINTNFQLHVKEVSEVWSPKQMQQVKNEVYRQKNLTQKVAGIIIAIQVIFGIIVAFKDKLF